NTAYAVPICSRYSHARIVSIDCSRAEQLAGVRAILTRDQLPEYDLNLEPRPGDQRFIVTDKVRFDGDLIGMVAADDLRTARRAADLVDVEYEPLAPIFSVEDARSPGAPLLHEDLGTNFVLADTLEWGDVERGFAESDHIFEEEYVSQNVYQHPIEPATTYLVQFDDDGLNFWIPMAGPFHLAAEAARLFRIDPKQVRVRVPWVGGNFGAKEGGPDAMVAAALARKLGRPIRVTASWDQSFRSSARHAMIYRAKIGARSDGTLQALDVQILVDAGAYLTRTWFATQNAVSSAWGGYRIPHVRVRGDAFYTNKVPAGTFRNTGKNQTTFSIECAMDNVARQLGIEPVEFRQKNLLVEGEIMAPERWIRHFKEAPSENVPLDTNLMGLMQAAANGIGWDGRSSSGQSGGQPAPRKGIRADGRTAGPAQGRGARQRDGCFTPSWRVHRRRKRESHGLPGWHGYHQPQRAGRGRGRAHHDQYRRRPNAWPQPRGGSRRGAGYVQ
ncbi:MAG: hypothetical protein HW416_78, partial [Chloroflexi bacterium]|nr:hypothetical protein [Chloroflexota bacterium]